MFPVTIKFVKTHPLAVLPSYNHPDPYTGDTGLDVVSVEDVLVPHRRVDPSFKGIMPSFTENYAIVPVGLKLAFITPGYWFKVEGRSGLGFKHGLLPHPGIIDNPYRGDCGIKLYNHSNKDYQIKAGDKIAQFIIYPLIQSSIEWADEVSDTKRGEKGFGSSG